MRFFLKSWKEKAKVMALISNLKKERKCKMCIRDRYYTPEDITKIQSGAPDAPATPYTDIPVQAGDLKYADLNNDGTIDDRCV